MDNDINREVNIEQVEFGIDIDNIEYSIDIMPTPSFEISLNEQGPQGARGYTGNGIESYVKTSSSGLTDTYTITFTDGNTTTVDVTNGRGIVSITGPVSVGNVDTYTINYNDNTTSTFTVTNGIDGVNPTVTVGTTTTGLPGTNANVVNSGTTQDVVLNFTIPRGDKGDTGETGPKGDKGETGNTGATGNGIVNIEKASTVGLVDTYHINYTNGNYDSFNVTNGRNGEGSVADVTVNGVSVLDGSVAKVLVPTNNNQLTNGAGYITGITSSDVTTALGYTPLSNATKYGSSLSYSSNVLQLLDQDGNGLGSSVTIQSSPDIDNKSITTNSSDELQTVGVINQNNTTNAIKTWTGTRAQYEAIVTKDANTLYNITDDSDVTFALLELLFPVGAVYFGTMSVCPLQTLGVGTWQALPQDKVIQIAGTRGDVSDTLNAGLPNITGSFGSGWEAIVSTDVGNISASGLFAGSTGQSYGWHGFSQHEGRMMSIKADASLSNPIYGNSSTVQPDAYLLNGWRRIS